MRLTNFRSLNKVENLFSFALTDVSSALSECMRHLEPGLGVGIPHIRRNRSTILLSRTFWHLCIPRTRHIVGHPSSCLTRRLSSHCHEVLTSCMRTSLPCRASWRYRNRRSGACHQRQL